MKCPYQRLIWASVMSGQIASRRASKLSTSYMRIITSGKIPLGLTLEICAREVSVAIVESDFSLC